MKFQQIFTREESAHWYDWSGAPHHTIIGANGNERATTLRDARKFNWLPSVSGIIKVAASPQLEKWQATQYLIAAFNSPPTQGEEPETWAKRIIEAGHKESTEAMDFGSQLHAICENYNLSINSGIEPGITWEMGDEKLRACYESYVAWARSEIAKVIAVERTMVNRLGFAGTTDLIYRSRSGAIVVSDIKTKKTAAGKPIITYENYRMQLSAYIHSAAEMGICSATASGNIYLSTTEPGRVEFVAFKRDEWEHYWSMFRALLTYWQLDKGYTPTPQL